jgi:hypothetical protein
MTVRLDGTSEHGARYGSQASVRPVRRGQTGSHNARPSDVPIKDSPRVIFTWARCPTAHRDNNALTWDTTVEITTASPKSTAPEFVTGPQTVHPDLIAEF